MEEETRLSLHASGDKTGPTAMVSKKYAPGQGEQREKNENHGAKG